MHCALRRNRSNTQKVLDAGKGSRLRKFSKLNNFRTSPEDCEELSLAWRNSDQRFSFLTFLALEPDGQWKMIALPLQCCDHSNHLEPGGHVKMDGLHLVSQPSMRSFKVDRKNAQGGHPCNNVSSIKPYMARSFSVPHVQRKTQNKAPESRTAKLNELYSESSCQNAFPCTDLSGLKISGSDGSNSSDMSIENPKANKVVKKNARKKTRKKGNQKKKLSCDSVSALEVNSDGGLHGSLNAQTCASNDMDHGNELNSCETASSISLSGCRANGSNSEGDSNNVVYCSEIRNECTSFIDETDASKGILPSVLSNFTNEHRVDSSEDGLQTRGPVLSNLNGEEDTCCKCTSYYDDSCSKGLFEMPDSLVLDSFSVGWNSDGSATAANDDKTFNGVRDGITSSELHGHSARKGCFSHLHTLNDDADSYNDVGTCSNNSDIQLFPSGKRGKQAGRAHKNSSVCQVGGAKNLHNHLGKENNHSVWQKVQKNDSAGCDFKMKKANSVCTELGVTLKGSDVVESSILSKPDDKNHLKVKASRKLKRKTSPGSKQDYSCYSRKESHTIKPSSNACPTRNLQQNEPLNIQNEVNYRKGLGSTPQIGARAKRETSDGMHIHSDGLEPVGFAYNTVSAINNRTTETQNSSRFELRDYFSQSNMVEVESSVPLPLLAGNEVSELDKRVSTAEYGRQGHNSGSILQKWIPVGLKEPESTSFAKSDSSSLSHLEEPDADGCALKNIVGEEFVSTSQSIIASSTNTGEVCIDQSSVDLRSSSVDDGQIQNLAKQNTRVAKEHNNKHVLANFSVLESNAMTSVVEDGSEKILQAVEDACKVRIASEAVQMTAGSPIAEFERFLHSASPVICQSSYVPSCRSCLPDQVIGSSLCRHDMPTVSLGSLWQWYEKHGSYGLEVRAEDHKNSKRLGADHFSFRAYFVPFLSAVQLFGNHKSCPMDDNKGIPGEEAPEPCKMVEMSEGSSNVGRLSIFSVLIPEPHSKSTNIPVVNKVFPRDEMSDTKLSDDSELLFEYFEYEPPQQRRPLFEKIKEMVKGDGRCQAYGDPTKLDSLDLRDVHPRSWYSVAWYPIYKIPDGNFRAAFLTYHSLGHLVCRSDTTTYESGSTDVCIVSPVVGLQSYNTQDESWFQLKHAAGRETAGAPPSVDTSAILKERLRTLEQTASLMARASVNKGDVTSVNRHPDYEFFLSRWR